MRSGKAKEKICMRAFWSLGVVLLFTVSYAQNDNNCECSGRTEAREYPPSFDHILLGWKAGENPTCDRTILVPEDCWTVTAWEVTGSSCSNLPWPEGFEIGRRDRRICWEAASVPPCTALVRYFEEFTSRQKVCVVCLEMDTETGEERETHRWCRTRVYNLHNWNQYLEPIPNCSCSPTEEPVDPISVEPTPVT